MDLYEEILRKALEQGEIRWSADKDPAEYVEMVCYRTLIRIREIVADDSLSDPECFGQIEEIVCALEGIGSDGGFRHDFG